MGKEVPFTGIVVVYNEDDMLRNCLESLYFCDDLIVVDLGSEDESIDIAKDVGARVVHHEHVPTAPEARKYGAEHASTEWVVYLDPDEIFPSHLDERIRDVIRSCENVGKVMIPWLFHFDGEPLYGTRWGGEKYKGHVVSRKKCHIGPPHSNYVHKDVSLKEGYVSRKIEWNEKDAIRHYWADSWGELFEKHRRYIENEGETRYEEGERFPGWGRWARRVAAAFKRCYIDHKGWKEGGTGLLLSAFWAWYKGASLLALRRHQREARLQNI